MTNFEPKPFGKFFLTDKIAIGGMAEIYKAKTFGVDGFEKQVAIKKILPNYSADKEFIAMLTDEAKLVVKLSHANIVQIYDLGKVSDNYYISMEFIDGVNLRELMTRAKELNESIPVPLCLYIVSEICKGLDYAHGKRDENSKPLHIVHRDISPQNILISYEGETKIVDFGIAKATMNMSQTTAGILKGKITYMSPEQALGKPVDNKTDIFSAGILLYELLTGKRLFSGETQFEVLKNIRTSQITHSSLPEEIPDRVRTALAKALSYQSKNRFDTAGDFQVALTKILYTEYNDFSSKQLGSFVKKCFQPELENRGQKVVEEKGIDNETKMILDKSSQESIVKRDEPNFSETELLMDTTKPEDMIKASDLDHGEKELENKKVKQTSSKKVIFIILSLLLLVGGMATLLHTLKNKKSTTPDNNTPAVLTETPPVLPEPEPMPEPEPEPEPKWGILDIDTEPTGANLTIDGLDKGQTPETIDELEIGRSYILHITKEGFEPLDKTIKITDENILSLTLSLKAIKKEAPTPILTPTPLPTVVEPIKKETAEKTPLIETKPIKNPTPVKTKIIKEPTKPVEETPIAPVDTKDTNGLKGLRIDSNPRGASVTLDGGKAGITPIIIRNTEKNKTHSVTLTLPGYQPWSQTITMSKAYMEISAKLKK